MHGDASEGASVRREPDNRHRVQAFVSKTTDPSRWTIRHVDGSMRASADSVRHTVAMRRDDAEDLFSLGRPDRDTLSIHTPAGWQDLAVTLTLFGLTLPMLVVGWFGVLLSMMAFDACAGGGCNDTAGTIAYIGFPIAAVVSIALWASLAERRRRARRRAWMCGAAAVLTIVALFALAATVVHFAAQPA